MRTILFAAAELDNQVRAERCRSGLRAAACDGYWCVCPPWGMKIEKRDRKAILVPDGDKAVKLQGIFRDVASKNISPTTAYALMEGIGVPKNTAWRLLRNPVYGGIIRQKLTDGMDVRAKFDGLITPEEFYKIEGILNTEKRKCERRIDDDGFPFNGILYCSICGKKLTSAFSTGKMGKKYPYYFCKKKGHLNVSATKLNEAIRDMIVGLDGITEIIVEQLKRGVAIYADVQAEAVKQRSVVQHQLTMLDTKISKAHSAWAQGQMDDDEYAGVNATIRTLRAECHAKLADIPQPHDIEETIVYLRREFADPMAVYDRLDAESKKQLVYTIYGNFFVEPNKLSNSVKLNRNTIESEENGTFEGRDSTISTTENKKWSNSPKAPKTLIDLVTLDLLNENGGGGGSRTRVRN